MPELLRVGSLALHQARPAHPTGAPVLFVHGILAGGWIFDRWLSDFAAHGHPAAAVDLRGHGDSPTDVPLGRLGLQDYLEDVVAAARTLDAGGAGPVVVGHSMGGLLAQKAAELGLARALVLVGTAPPRGISVLTARLARRMTAYTGALLLSRALVPRAADLDDLSLNAVAPDERRALLAQFGAESGRAARELALGGIAVDARKVRCPVLVLAGSADRFIPVARSRRVAARYGAELRVLDGHGHLPMREPGWEAVSAGIREWIARLGTDARDAPARGPAATAR